MGPHLARVMGDEDRDVPHQMDALGVRVLAQGRPLAEEQILDESMPLQLLGMRLRPGGEGLGLAQCERLRPVGPGPMALIGLDGGVERVVRKPVLVLGLEAAEVILLGPGRACQEPLVRPLEQPPLPDLHRAEIHPAIGKLGMDEIRIVDPAGIPEKLRTHQEWVAGQRRGALIGRVAVAGRSQGQDLPQPLPRLGEEVHESEGRGSEIPDAMGPGQRGRVQQDAAGTVHVGLHVMRPMARGSLNARHGGGEQPGVDGPEPWLAVLAGAILPASSRIPAIGTRHSPRGLAWPLVRRQPEA